MKQSINMKIVHGVVIGLLIGSITAAAKSIIQVEVLEQKVQTQRELLVEIKDRIIRIENMMYDAKNIRH